MQNAAILPHKLVSGLLALGLIALTACSSTPQYRGFEAFRNSTSPAIAEEINIYEADGLNYIAAPWVEDLAHASKTEQTVMATRIYAYYDPSSDAVTQFIELKYSVMAEESPALELEYDRARVHGGYLQPLANPEQTQACEEKSCISSATFSVPVTLANIHGNRYRDIDIELIAPSETPAIFRLPSTYLRAYSYRLANILADDYMDINRISDTHAPPQEHGRDQLRIEGLAVDLGCLRESVRTVSIEGPTSVFQMECENNSMVFYQCHKQLTNVGIVVWRFQFN
jgi:hypothetical protein